MTERDDRGVALSVAGQRRRAEILDQAAGALDGRVRARRLRRGAASLACVAAVAAKRKEITAQLDRELKAWLEDPKAREAERIAFMMTSYARQESEFARFWQDVGARVGVKFPGAAP